MFENRFDAARQLADALAQYKDRDDVVIVAIPRGALQIGLELHQLLHAPLDVVFTKKIGAPGNPELAIGAASLDTYVLDPAYASNSSLEAYAREQFPKIQALLEQRQAQYRQVQPAHDLSNKIVIIVDDGIATGHTMRAAIEQVKHQHPSKIIVAVPVASSDVIDKLSSDVDEVVSLMRPQIFFGIGQFYKDFTQVSDDEAVELLRKARS